MRKRKGLVKAPYLAGRFASIYGELPADYYPLPAREPQAARAPRAPEVAMYADVLIVRTGKARGYAGKREGQDPPRPGLYEEPPRPKRGECQGFSRRSRRRLMVELAKTRTDGLHSLFVTLTYPGELTEDMRNWRTWKRHIAAFRKRLQRRWRTLTGGVWKIEFQKRGAAHFHIMLFFDCKMALPQFRAWVSRSWYEIVGSGQLSHLRAGTNVKRLDGRRAIRAYVSKYVAKIQPDGVEIPAQWGRTWGFFGEIDRTPIYHRRRVQLAEVYTLRRAVRRWVRAQGFSGCQRYADYLRNAETMVVIGLGEESMGASAAVGLLGWASTHIESRGTWNGKTVPQL